MEKVTFGALVVAAAVRRHLVKHDREARRAETAAESEAAPGAVEAPAAFTLEDAVHIACGLAQHVRAKYIFGTQGEAGGAVFGKQDTSPVTLADLSIQVLVTAMLKHILGPDAGPLRLVGEEDAAVFAEGGAADGSGGLDAVVALLREFLPPAVAESQAGDCGGVNAAFVLRTLREAADAGGPGTFWTLDPIDGTKGFILEGGQYAVGLACVEDGQVVRSIIGCPVLSSAFVCGDPRQLGCVYSATRGGGAFVRAVEDNGTLGPAKRCVIPTAPNRAEMKVAGSRAHHASAGGGVVEAVASMLGLHPRTVAIDSMVKYALVVRGEAHLYARIYHYIWDFAPGCLLVEEAGGKVTDEAGQPIDFAAQGRGLQKPFIVAASDAQLHADVLAGIGAVSGPAQAAADGTAPNRRISISDCD